MSYVNKRREELKIPEITIEEFDALSGTHQFSNQYERRKHMLIQEYKENRSKMPRRNPFRVAVAAAAICVVGTVGVYATVSHSDFFGNAFGNNGRQSVPTHIEIQDQGDKGKTPVQVPAREYVTVDADVAEKNIGDYVMNTPITKKLNGHTLTILSAVRDEQCMVMEFTLEKKGGEDALVYNEKTNMTKGAYLDGAKADIYFSVDDAADCIYVDMNKSTDEKLYCYDYIVFNQPIAAGQSVSMTLETTKGGTIDEMWEVPGAMREEQLTIPVTKTVPSIAYTSKKGGQLNVSALGMVLDMGKGLGLKGAEASDPSSLDNIKVQYKDGTKYVVEDENTYNAGYSCGFDELYKLTFNRLVELNQIDTISVNGIAYQAK